MRTGFPCNESRYFPVGIDLQGFPVSCTGFGFTVCCVMLTDKQQQVVNFDKTLFEYSLKNKTFLPIVFVIKLQLSKISVNMSKGHTYFEEFTLWILIKKNSNFEYSLKKKPFCSSLPDQLSRFMPNTFLLAHF